MIEEILNEEQLKKILDADHTWEQGTTLSGVERESYVCWLNKSEWQWLFNLIDSWILRSWPESAGIPDFDASAIQLTRYDAPSGYYGWHDDDYPGANRVLSSIIMLQNADEGGELQFRDQNIDLKPGQGVVFPSPTEHQVTEVTKGTRYSLVRWLSQRVSEVKQEQQESFQEPDAPAQDLRVVELEDKTNFATNSELQLALLWLKNNKGLILPYNLLPTGHNLHDFPYVDLGNKTAWDNYRWNPPQYSHYTVVTDASEKPTWKEIIDAHKHVRIEGLKSDTEYLLNTDFQDFGVPDTPKTVRKKLADSETIIVDGLETHIHGGVDRMTALINMVEDANEANTHIPYIHMRNAENQPIQIYTQRKTRKILNAVSQRRNIVESAHNKIMKEYQNIADKIDGIEREPSPNQPPTLDQRLEYAEQAKEYIDNYATHLQAAINDYDPNALPDDLPTLKEVYQERIESHALGHSKFMRGVLTQQGIDLPPSCNDEANALQKVSVESVKGHILVNLATTNEEATTAYDNALAAISSVWPLNTPTWNIEGTEYVARPADSVDITGTSITIEGYHPTVLDAANNEDLVKVKIASQAQKIVNDVPGPVGLSLTSRTAENPKGSKVTYTPQGVQSGDLVRFIFTGRNLCGPSEITVNLTIP